MEEIGFGDVKNILFDKPDKPKSLILNISLIFYTRLRIEKLYLDENILAEKYLHRKSPLRLL